MQGAHAQRPAPSGLKPLALENQDQAHKIRVEGEHQHDITLGYKASVAPVSNL